MEFPKVPTPSSPLRVSGRSVRQVEIGRGAEDLSLAFHFLVAPCVYWLSEISGQTTFQVQYVLQITG